MLKRKIREILLSYLHTLPEGYEIERVKDPKYGDYSSNLPFLLSREKKEDPQRIGLRLVDELRDLPEFEEVSVGGKGFLNFKYSLNFLLENLKEVMSENYGRLNLGKGKKILVEYISANPTGPLNIVNARAGVLGNILVNLLNFTGFIAKREYYVNDGGVQIQLLFQSLKARIAQLQGRDVEIPQEGYPGKYLIEIAEEIIKKKIPEEKWKDYLIERMVRMQRKSLERLGLHFDSWIYESRIRPDNKETLSILKQKGLSYKKDEAIWFKSTEFGDSKDRVLVKKNGEFTYFLTDLSYHRNKFGRGFEWLIDIFGPDHHGDIPRLKGGIEALGFKRDALKILIAQHTTFTRGGKKVSMSKRAGEYITLDEILDEVGPDALKFFLLMRKASQHLEFDLELAKRTSKENPVYYVQYAHARIESILKFAKGFDLKEKPLLSLLKKGEERELVRTLLEFPDIIEEASLNLEPHQIVYYLLDLATKFHYFYERCRVVSSDRELSIARLYLSKCVKRVLRIGLDIIGVSAPEKM